MNNLEERMLEISYKHKLCYIGSYLSSLEIIDQIYKNEKDIFILSSGHAVVALYVILEKYYGLYAEKLQEEHGEHPHRSERDDDYKISGSSHYALKDVSIISVLPNIEIFKPQNIDEIDIKAFLYSNRQRI